MYTLESINQKVDSAIKQLDLTGEPRNLYEPIAYIMSMGGKRIRPALVLAACNLYSDDIDQALPAALAVELFHNFTLVHDDIMDNADMRRGLVTIHKKWNPNIAILSGDAMTVLAYKLLVQVDKSILPEVINIFNSFAMGICEGQQMDMDFESDTMVSRDEYLKMIELKTSILLKGALQIGAVIGGAGRNDVELIGEFGRSMGLAFQLQDDLLDCYGDSSTFGKRIGGDIVASKKTMLTIITAEKLKGTQRSDFIELYNSKSLTDQLKIGRVMDYYSKAEVQHEMVSIIDTYFDNATQAINKLNVSESRKDVLNQILTRLIGRKN
ncbi:polyprenyl synthetase family protein [Tenuifilum sp.]|uniref:polyprenyl synthetase family protein n=1 Tax=Tenuifilum sp. TaxID=2760880 RepID=UPI001B6088FA|nr:polyprenyl synthetase family protein [Bacteroidales bacterium]HOK61524.1 polyprenyl synthetase family protein [Tenuifilum sp.]HOK85994.1 polyprenyl synthetase family protein [Tenuifilum sp.]HON70973.1 polyprenyl synthetase family protein [Tenuifilum sp.]HOU73471.1 polyprenyl synthetase family protein [Tenuifilum sp.]